MTHPLPIRIEPAYKRLTTSERAIVDMVVKYVQATAHLKQERITSVLDRDWDVPDGLIDDEAREVLQRPFVTAAVHERLSAIASKTDVSVEWWLRETMALASSNMGDYFRMERNMMTGEVEPVLSLEHATPEQWGCIKSLKIKKPGMGIEGVQGRTEIDIQLYDRLAPLDRIGRFIGAADADNPYWAQRGNGMTQAPPLPQDASVEDAGEAYSKMLNGG